MPIAVDTDPGGSFLILTVTDPYTFEEWRAAMETALVSMVFAATKAVLVDRREAVAPSLVFVDQVVGFFRSHEQQLVNARVGIVANETLAFGMSRMVELKSEASLRPASFECSATTTRRRAGSPDATRCGNEAGYEAVTDAGFSSSVIVFDSTDPAPAPLCLSDQANRHQGCTARGPVVDFSRIKETPCESCNGTPNVDRTVTPFGPRRASLGATGRSVGSNLSRANRTIGTAVAAEVSWPVKVAVSGGLLADVTSAGEPRMVNTAWRSGPPSVLRLTGVGG